MIDLHCHSQASDGSVPPECLPSYAASKGVSAVALTDHDTVRGIAAFLAAGRCTPVETVSGVEVACCFGKRHLHILGLFLDHRSAGLAALLRRVRAARTVRNEIILARLSECGVPLDARDLPAETDDSVLGRPHLAQALVRRGYCSSPADAFQRFLGRGRAAYVPRELPSPEEVLAVLHGAGAVTIWAHPLVSRSLTNSAFRRTASALQACGLDGVEVRYPDHTATRTRVAEEVARELSLLPAGGSDFHGDHVPSVEIGIGRGRLGVPDAWLPPLRARAAALARGGAAGSEGAAQDGDRCLSEERRSDAPAC